MRRFLAAMGLAAVVWSGCYTTPVGGYYYDYAYYDPYWYAYDAAYAYSWVDPVGVSYLYLSSGGSEAAAIDTSGIAVGIANAANTYYSPAGCANASVSGSTVTYNFVNCNGPFGLTSLNGPLTLVVSDSNGQLVLTANSDGVSVAGITLIIDSQTTVTSNGTTRQASVVSHTRDPSRVDTRDAQLTVTWVKGEGCFNVQGTDNSTSAAKTTTSTLTDYRRCTNQCPASGTISVVTPNTQYIATFDGSSTLNVVNTNGAIRSFTLNCQ